MIKIIPTTAISLFDLLGLDKPQVTEVFIQASKTNVADINFGPLGEVDHFLEMGKSAIVPLNNLKTYFVKGNGTDTLIITIFRV